MLVLSRKLGESIQIGDDVTVTVLGIHGATIKLGTTAPRDVPIHRTEIISPADVHQAVIVHGDGTAQGTHGG